MVSAGEEARRRPALPEIVATFNSQIRMMRLYVGDSGEHDVEGARAAGMIVVLLDRHRLGRQESDQPRSSASMQLLEFLDPKTANPPLEPTAEKRGDSTEKR